MSMCPSTVNINDPEIDRYRFIARCEHQEGHAALHRETRENLVFTWTEKRWAALSRFTGLITNYGEILPTNPPKEKVRVRRGLG